MFIFVTTDPAPENQYDVKGSVVANRHAVRKTSNIVEPGRESVIGNLQGKLIRLLVVVIVFGQLAVIDYFMEKHFMKIYVGSLKKYYLPNK